MVGCSMVIYYSKEESLCGSKSAAQLLQRLPLRKKIATVDMVYVFCVPVFVIIIIGCALNAAWLCWFVANLSLFCLNVDENTLHFVEKATAYRVDHTLGVLLEKTEYDFKDAL